MTFGTLRRFGKPFNRKYIFIAHGAHSVVQSEYYARVLESGTQSGCGTARIERKIYELRYEKFHNVCRRCYYCRKGNAYSDLRFELFFCPSRGEELPFKR